MLKTFLAICNFFENFTTIFIIQYFFNLLKFIYSEKATQFCEISTLLLTTVHTVKSRVEIYQNFVAFSEYMRFQSDLIFIIEQLKC
jgi:hypothetical protein